MVYDVSRNYIGDMHWREDEILQDGDEFQLDRGVLIQVGEATGSMEQDLSGLFEKRKKAPDVAVNEEVPHQPEALPMARITAAQPSQLRPKTLNALLGTPQGRIGRAALPTRSPHELHLESENNSWDQDRPAKRQRIEPQLRRRAEPNTMPPPQVPAGIRFPDEGVNRTVVGANVDKQSEDRRIPATAHISNLSTSGNAVSIPPISSIQRSENDKEDEASKRAAEPLSRKRPSGSGSAEPSAQKRKRNPDQDVLVSPKAKRIAKRLNHEPETGNARTSTIAKPIEIASDEDATSTNEQPKQRLKLQIASRKPRKKLMYRDLLPQESPAIGSSGDASEVDRISHHRNISSRPGKRNGDSMGDFHKEEQERLKARLERHRAKEIQRENEQEEFCGDAPEDLFLSQDDIGDKPANDPRTEEREPKEKDHQSSMTGSRRNTEPVPSSARRSLPQKAPQKKIPRPPSTVHSTATSLAQMDEVLFSRSRRRTSESVEDKDALTEASPQESSPPPVPKIPSDAVSTKPFKEWPGSSPAFQTQVRVPPTKTLHTEDPTGISTVSRIDLDPRCAFTKVVQPKAQELIPPTAKIMLSDLHLSSFPAKPPKTIFPPTPLQLKQGSVSAAELQTHPDFHPTRPLTSEPPIASVVPSIKEVTPNSLPTFSDVVAPNPPTAPEPVLRRKANNQPAFTKIIPTIPIPKIPDETVEVPSSQPSSSPPPEAPIIAPQPPKRKPDSLPAFTKVVPTKPRSPLKKSISDTSAMRPPSALPISGGKEKTLPDNPVGKDENAGLWSKEAWDLFGCSRDGVECTYEDFKRKEGLL